jgi:hypothetical protein
MALRWGAIVVTPGDEDKLVRWETATALVTRRTHF